MSLLLYKLRDSRQKKSFPLSTLAQFNRLRPALGKHGVHYKSQGVVKEGGVSGNEGGGRETNGGTQMQIRRQKMRV